MNKKLLKSILCIASGVAIAASIPFAATSCGCSSSEEKINPLPEDVYKFSDDGKTLLGFKDEFLNNSASDIYKDNFQECNTMQIPANVTSVANNAFTIKNPSTQEYETTIPSFITKLTFAENSNCSRVGIRAFINCSSLTSVNLLNCQNLTVINNSAFQNCFNLTSVDLSNCSSLIYINGGTFANCSSLDSVDLSNTKLEILEYKDFQNCSKLISIKIPSTVKRVHNEVFDNCPNLSSITWNAWTGSFVALESSSFGGVCQSGTVKVTNPTDGHDSAALLAILKQSGGLPSGWEVAKD